MPQMIYVIYIYYTYISRNLDHISKTKNMARRCIGALLKF